MQLPVCQGQARCRPAAVSGGRRVMFLLFAQSGFSSDYKLTDLLSSAAATVGVIIFGTIFLQFLSGKYMELTSRFRALAGEYRNGGAGEVRHHSLQEQMTLYRRRLHLMRW